MDEDTGDRDLGDDGSAGDGGPLGVDALLGALGAALRSGSWQGGWPPPGWSASWSAAAREVPPELADHLLAATAQLLGAVRGFVEVAERVVDDQRARRHAPDAGAGDAGAGAEPDDPVAAEPVAAGDPDEDPAAAEPPTPRTPTRSRRVRRIPLDET